MGTSDGGSCKICKALEPLRTLQKDNYQYHTIFCILKSLWKCMWATLSSCNMTDQQAQDKNPEARWESNLPHKKGIGYVAALQWATLSSHNMTDHQAQDKNSRSKEGVKPATPKRHVICDYGEIQMHQTLVLYRPPTF